MNGQMISIIIHANHLSPTNLAAGGRRLSNELNGTNSPNLPPPRVWKSSSLSQSRDWKPQLPFSIKSLKKWKSFLIKWLQSAAVFSCLHQISAWWSYTGPSDHWTKNHRTSDSMIDSWNMISFFTVYHFSSFLSAQIFILAGSWILSNFLKWIKVLNEKQRYPL